MNDNQLVVNKNNIFAKIKMFFKNMFCKHNWVKIGFREVENTETRYSMRHYECEKCGKRKWVDGRTDTLGNRPRVYFYILRDYSWWQRVSESIYDTWPQPKMVSAHVLSEDELEEELLKICSGE